MPARATTPYAPRLAGCVAGRPRSGAAAGRRYLDKLPRNPLRVLYLQSLFPDASFVFLRRDGRAVVSSLMTGWRSGARFGRGMVPPIPLAIEGYEGTTWKFLLPPGWEA